MMMTAFKQLRKNDSGVAAIEFAMIMPVLLVIILGILQLGILFAANAGLQTAVGEAARYATIYPTPSDADIKARASSKRFAIDSSRISDFTVVRGTSNTVNYVEVSMTYSVPLEFIFFKAPSVSLTEKRRAYLP